MRRCWSNNKNGLVWDKTLSLEAALRSPPPPRVCKVRKEEGKESRKEDMKGVMGRWCFQGRLMNNRKMTLEREMKGSHWGTKLHEKENELS